MVLRRKARKRGIGMLWIVLGLGFLFMMMLGGCPSSLETSGLGTGSDPAQTGSDPVETSSTDLGTGSDSTTASGETLGAQGDPTDGSSTAQIEAQLQLERERLQWAREKLALEAQIQRQAIALAAARSRGRRRHDPGVRRSGLEDTSNVSPFDSGAE